MPDEDLTRLDAAELESLVAAIRDRMRPLDAELATMRSERDLLLTELRRRGRLVERTSRADLKAQMREGTFPTVAELVAGTDDGSLDDYAFNLKTGGEVRLGFPDTKPDLHRRGQDRAGPGPGDCRAAVRGGLGAG